MISATGELSARRFGHRPSTDNMVLAHQIRKTKSVGRIDRDDRNVGDAGFDRRFGLGLLPVSKQFESGYRGK